MKHAYGLSGPLEYKDNENAAHTDSNEVKTLVANFMSAFEEFKTKSDREIAEIKKNQVADPVTKDEVKKLNTALDQLTEKVTNMRLEERRPEILDANGQKRTLTEIEVKHAAAFKNFMTTGDDSELRTPELKALSIGSDPDGGYTVHSAMESTIDRVLSEVSPIRSIAALQQISTSSVKRLVNVGGTSSGWVGEQSSRPQTDASQLRERQFPVMELYAMPAATQSLLDDSAVNIEQWMAEEVNIKFAEQEGNAFVMGDGVDKPRGFIGGYTPIANASFTEAGARLGYIATGASGAFKTTADGDDSDNLIDLVYSLKAGYRQGARWCMNSLTQGEVRKIQDANGNKVWQPGLQAGQPASLLGYAITTAEDMPDIAADSYSIAFGDFRRSYLIVDRVGIRVLRDPFTSKPHILFYTTKRVGGGLKLFEPLKLLKFGTS